MTLAYVRVHMYYEMYTSGTPVVHQAVPTLAGPRTNMGPALNYTRLSALYRRYWMGVRGPRVQIMAVLVGGRVPPLV